MSLQWIRQEAFTRAVKCLSSRNIHPRGLIYLSMKYAGVQTGHYVPFESARSNRDGFFKPFLQVDENQTPRYFLLFSKGITPGNRGEYSHSSQYTPIRAGRERYTRDWIEWESETNFNVRFKKGYEAAFRESLVNGGGVGKGIPLFALSVYLQTMSGPEHHRLDNEQLLQKWIRLLHLSQVEIAELFDSSSLDVDEVWVDKEFARSNAVETILEFIEPSSGSFDGVQHAAEPRGDDFPPISVDAYEAAPDEVLADESEEVEQAIYAPKTWVIAMGARGEMWDDCRQNAIAAIGWDELGDLRQYTDKEEIRQRLQADAGVASSKKNSTLACWQFANSIQPGDVIFAKGGATTVLGLGTVIGDYEFDETRPKFKHVRSVDWQLSGEWELPDDIRHPLKTLTDISRYPKRISVMHETVGRAAPEPTARVAEEPPLDGVAYWWLNANPAIWDLRSGEIGSLQTYTTHNEAGNKRRVFKYFLQAKPGDLIIGYSTSPDREIVSICEVTKGVHVADGKERIEFRKVEQLAEPVTYEELKAAPGLAQCEPIVSNHQGSLFSVTPAEFEIIRALIDDHVAGQKSTSVLPFSKEDALEDLFMGEDVLDAILARIRRKKAVILQGPPGVGKTFVAKRLAFALMGQKDEQRVAMVQFHPSYAYEDFVQGYRPSERGLERRDGVFYRFVRLARNNPDKDWFFIIDEINRGNLAKIFGELLMLIEADKRGQRHAIPLTYSESAAETFHLPENLYFIGTMNTADRSLAMVDYALRRRFSFVTLQPELDSKAFGQWLKGRGAGDALVDRIKQRVGEVNKVIAQERDLGPGFQIGHSFFCPPEGTAPDELWFQEVVHGEISPLLEEYFESRDKVDSLVRELLG